MLRWMTGPVTLVASVILCSSPVAAKTTTTLSFNDIRSDLQAQCARQEFSGAVLVQEDERSLFSFVCAAPGTAPLTTASRFKLFSMSKIFTGMAIARLAERGRIDPEASITRYINHVPPAWHNVRVSELLMHISGIPDLTDRLGAEFDDGASSHHVAMARLMQKLETENPPLSFGTETRWRYNNFAYELLAEIGAAAAGRPFDKVLRDTVLRPAGMKTAVVAMPSFESGRIVGSAPVKGLVPGYNGKPGALTDSESKSYVQLGAGAVIGTLADLRAYDRAMRSSVLLSLTSQARNAERAFPVNDRVRYGYGVMYRRSGGCSVIQHSGGNNGYVSEFARIPDRRVVVIILSNLGFMDVGALRSKLVDKVTAAHPCS